MSISTAIIITIIAIIFSALFSGTEIAYVQSSKVRMEIDAAKGKLTDRVLASFFRHEDMFISSLLVGNNIVLVVYGITISIIINPLLENWFDGNEALVLVFNTLLSTLIILICGEFLPKTTFRINPNFTMRLIALPIFLIYIVLYPLSLFISLISKGMMKILGISDNTSHSSMLTIEQLDDYLQKSIATHSDRQAVENEVKIFRNAIDFKDTQIAECMIPRNEIVAVGIEGTSRSQLIRRFIETGLSKIVVYKEDIDDIVGYIHVSELFNTDADWKTKIKPVLFTPESMLANKMMRRMLAGKKSMVVVVDEFGGTAGICTLEDLVEEIFGEIEDEHDHHRLLARKLSDGSFEFSGRAEIEYINENFGLDIRESEDYNTIAGFILENLEALPGEGAVFQIDDLEFKVLRMSATRIELIHVRKIIRS